MNAAMLGTLFNMFINSKENKGKSISQIDWKAFTNTVNQMDYDLDGDGKLSAEEKKDYAAAQKAEQESAKAKAKAQEDLIDKTKKSIPHKIAENVVYGLAETADVTGKVLAAPKIRLGDALNAMAQLDGPIWKASNMAKMSMLREAADKYTYGDRAGAVSTGVKNVLNDTMDRLNADRDKELAQEIMIKQGGTPNNGYYQELGRLESAGRTGAHGRK